MLGTVRLEHLTEWFYGWVPESVSVLGWRSVLFIPGILLLVGMLMAGISLLPMLSSRLVR